jgi:hypothetical protein
MAVSVRYVCCQCDADMTEAVQQVCSVPSQPWPLLTFKGTALVHTARKVVVTCPNNHSCEFPCFGSDND